MSSNEFKVQHQHEFAEGRRLPEPEQKLDLLALTEHVELCVLTLMYKANPKFDTVVSNVWDHEWDSETLSSHLM